MTSRFSTLLIFLFLFSVQGKTQSGSFYLKSNFQNVKSSAFFTFSNEYNALYGNDLSERLDPIQMGAGFGMGITSSAHGLKFGIEYNRVSSKMSATYTDGAVRDFKLTDGGVGFLLGYSPRGFLNHFYFYPVACISLGKNTMRTDYTPGSNNFNGDFLNGKYSAFTVRYFTGCTMGVGGEKVKLLLQFDYTGPVTAKKLVDKDKSGSSASIGQDYDTFTANPDTYKGEYLKSDFRGFRFSAGLAFDFGQAE